MRPPDIEDVPTMLPIGEEALLALLREAEEVSNTIPSLSEILKQAQGIEAPMDDTLLLGRVKLSKVTLRNMTKNKAKLNRRFKRNRVRKVGRPKSHHLTKKKLKKANNRRNYLKNVKPRRGDRCEKTDIV